MVVQQDKKAKKKISVILFLLKGSDSHTPFLHTYRISEVSWVLRKTIMMKMKMEIRGLK